MSDFASYDIEITQGNDWAQVFEVNDDAGNPIDLTGLDIMMRVRSNIQDSGSVLELSTGNGKITNGGSNGQISVTITSSDTSSLITQGQAIVYVYDMVTYAAGTPPTNVQPVVAGSFTLDAAITRPWA